jgi:hypothetical protein
MELPNEDRVSLELPIDILPGFVEKFLHGYK